ncbi:MAG: disulfide bond formation protein DsbA [Candidatus Latescibacteria bacterium]|nr:disulfide bond formation protein DsbA [Candidatus Latescibacterota bacterium]
MSDKAVSVTCFLEIQSSWCFWAEPTWSALKERFADQVEFSWEIALMPPEAFPVNKEQCEQFYRRSGLVVRSPFMLNSGWFEEELQGDYSAANLVAEAGKNFAISGDELRLALTRAGLVDGRKIGRIDEAVAVGVQACGLDAAALKRAALSATVRQQVEDSTRQFHEHQIDQRPAYVLHSAIGDKAVFSGVVGLAPLAATIEGMLVDVEGYAAFEAHFGAL